MKDGALFLRRLVAGLAGVASGLLFVVKLSDRERAPGCIPLIGLLIAAVVIHAPGLGPQLLARAAWWSSFALGVILCILAKGEPMTPAGMALVVACGGALLLVGRREIGAAGEQGGYAPTAFRSTLLLMMVLALADMQTFLLLGVLFLNESGSRNTPGATLLLLGSVGYLVGFVGLYRLALWGALLNVAISAGLFVAFTARLVPTDMEIRLMVGAITGVHLLATAPMLAALVFKLDLPKPGPRLRAFGAAAVIVAVGLGSLAMATRR